jgi:hypothetical protein
MDLSIDTWKVKVFSDTGEVNMSEEISDYIKYYEENLKETYRSFDALSNKKGLIMNLDNAILRNETTGKNIFLNTCMLDLNKDKLNILEKYVYDIAEFHCCRLNKNINECEVEFWLNKTFIENGKTLHFDHQEADLNIDNSYIIPFLSTLTYLSNNNYPTVITSLNQTNNESVKENKVVFSFPRNSNHISFDGGKFFHDACNVFDKKVLVKKMKKEIIERHVLLVQLWDIKQKYRPQFKVAPIFNELPIFNKNEKRLTIISNENSTKIIDLSDKRYISFKNEMLNKLNKVYDEEFRFSNFSSIPLLLNEENMPSSNFLGLFFKSLLYSPVKHNTFYPFTEIISENDIERHNIIIVQENNL